MPQPPMHYFSRVFPNIKWMVDPLTLGISCAFTCMIPVLDGILISLLCPSMNTLLWVMNSIPRMQSMSPKVETNKSTFPLQFLSWRGTSFAYNVMGWGTPSAKCTSMGALSFFNWSSILSALSQVMKLWEAPLSKRHNTFRLETFPFKKLRRLHSPWAKLVVRAITLEPPFPDLGLGQSLE
jgi:hypothetical protein